MYRIIRSLSFHSWNDLEKLYCKYNITHWNYIVNGMYELHYIEERIPTC